MTVEQRARSVMVDLCCAILLTVAVARLFQVNRALVAEIDAAQARFSLVPVDGSLANVVSEGTIVPASNRHPYLLLFVIHSSTMENDVKFWNAVQGEIRRQSLDIHLVGVCDKGKACDAAKESAAFRLVGFLDPYQSHALVTADGSGNALLYSGSRLTAQLQSSSRDASAVAVGVAEAVK